MPGRSPAPSLRRRLAVSLLALWIFAAGQLLALPSGALGSCAMACSLDGGACCCRLGVRPVSSTGEHRFFGRPWLEQRQRPCPLATTTAAPLPVILASADAGRRSVPTTDTVRVVSPIASGEAAGDSRLFIPPRPPPSRVVPRP